MKRGKIEILLHIPRVYKRFGNSRKRNKKISSNNGTHSIINLFANDYNIPNDNIFEINYLLEI